jgi:hypothetical protein
MFTLTDAEKNVLLNSAEPAVVAATKKLIAAEESGEFVPQSRLKAEIKEAKEAQKKLAEIEAAKKLAEEEEAKKKGEFEKLLETEKAAHQKTQAERDADKVDAEAFRKAKKEAVEAVKKLLGDKWLPEYETFSLESLGKIAGTQLPIIGTMNLAPSMPEKKTLETQLAELEKAGGNLAQIVALKNKIAEQNKSS